MKLHAGRRGRDRRARRGPGRLRLEREDRRPGSAGARRDNAGALVGVTMPTKSSERWIGDGDNIKTAARGARLQGRPAVRRERHPHPGQPDREPDHQGRQAADHRLDRRHRDHHAAAEAADNKIPVIAYDRLIRNSPNVDYYATFDNFKVGVQQATSLLVGLRPQERGRHRRAPPRARSTSSCSPARRTTTTPRSSSTARWRCSSRTSTTARWSSRAARPTSRPSRSCAGTRRPRRSAWRTCSPRPTAAAPRSHGVLSPYDGLSIGILSALKSSGYGTAGQPYPIVTGQDAEVASVKSIIAGEQYATIYKDTRELAKVTVEDGRRRAQGRQARGRTTPRTTTTASRSSRRTCSSR